MDSYELVLNQLRSAEHLVPAMLKGTVSRQLQTQGRVRPSPYRFAVSIEITEASARPAKDLDNYAKPIIDAITQSRLLWKDDTQIDELIIRRSRDGSLDDSSVHVVVSRIAGQHQGVPSYFRACCIEAGTGTADYANAGYHLALHLQGEAPYDLEEDAWLDSIARLVAMLDADDDSNAWIWFREHLPKFMALVPHRRKAQFLSGVRRAHEQGRLA